jgi:hypothetical protein
MAARKINQKDYTHYVLVFRGGRPLIHSGWSYPEDAKDAVREMLEFHPKLKVKVFTLRGLNKLPLDPDDNDSWFYAGGTVEYWDLDAKGNPLEGPQGTFIPRGDFWLSRRTHWAAVPSDRGTWIRKRDGAKVSLVSANLIVKGDGAQLIDTRWVEYSDDKNGDPERTEAVRQLRLEPVSGLGESYDPSYLLGIQKRVAKALGWSLQDVQSMSLASLREQVRPVNAKLAHELTEAIREMGA